MINKIDTDVIDNARSSQGFVYFIQMFKAPIKDFIGGYSQLKGRADQYVKKNFLGYEVVDLPELREFVRALIAVKDAKYFATNSSSEDESIDNNLWVKLESRVLLAAAIDLFSELPPSESEESPSEPKTNAIIRDKEAYSLAELANKAILIAYLKNDFKAFRKAFTVFEKAICKACPESYARGLCTASFAWIDFTSQRHLDLHSIDISPLLEESSDEFKHKYYLESSMENLTKSLTSENSLSIDIRCCNRRKKKIDSFVTNFFYLTKESLERDKIPEAKKNIEKSKVNHNKQMIAQATGKFEYFKLWCISWFDVLEGDSDFKDQLKVAKDNLGIYQDCLKRINGAAGFFTGFYYTEDLKQLFKMLPVAKGSNLAIAINAKDTEETLWQRIKKSAKIAWRNIRCGVSELLFIIKYAVIYAYQSVRGACLKASSLASAAKGVVSDFFVLGENNRSKEVKSTSASVSSKILNQGEGVKTCILPLGSTEEKPQESLNL